MMLLQPEEQHCLSLTVQTTYLIRANDAIQGIVPGLHSLLPAAKMGINISQLICGFYLQASIIAASQAVRAALCLWLQPRIVSMSAT